jgi:hypothetical protein
MWNTPSGKRKLLGAERRLFTHALIMHVDLLHDCDDYDFGVEILNDIVKKDLRYYFLLVGQALLSDDPVPEHFAWNEAIIHEICEEMTALIDYDYDRESEKDSHAFYTRWMLFNFLQETSEPGEKLPKIESAEKKEWMQAVNAFKDRVLWDEDFPMGHIFEEFYSKINYWNVPPSIGIRQRAQLDAFYQVLRAEDDPIWDSFPRRHHFKSPGKVLNKGK